MLINKYKQLARQKLPKMIYDYYAGAAWDEKTLHNNKSDFDQYEIVYRILKAVDKRTLNSNLLNQNFSAPIGVCPLAMQQMAHPEGEMASANAAHKLGLPYILSTLSNYTIEQIGNCFSNESHRPWFQLYIHKDRGLTLDLVKRAEAANFSAIVVTVDTPILGIRERDIENKFTMPEGLTLGTLSRSLPNTSTSGLMQDFADNICPNISFDDIDWLASKTKLPIILKGIVHPEDIKIAKEYGAAAAFISNHGGRQLDGCVSTIHALSIIKESYYANTLPLFIDGGFQRGKDILIALALGAQAVFIGRPILWGLAHSGLNGVTDILNTLINELDYSLALSGYKNIAQAKEILISKR